MAVTKTINAVDSSVLKIPWFWRIL